MYITSAVCCNYGHLCEVHWHQFVNQLIILPRKHPSIAKTSLCLGYVHLSRLVHNSCYIFHTSSVNKPKTVRKIVQSINFSSHVMPPNLSRMKTARCYQTQSVGTNLRSVRVQNTLIGASHYGNTLFHIYTSIVK